MGSLLTRVVNRLGERDLFGLVLVETGRNFGGDQIGIGFDVLGFRFHFGSAFFACFFSHDVLGMDVDLVVTE